MPDSYLWNRKGEHDPEIERLEQLLGSLRLQGSPPRFARRAAPWWIAVAAMLGLVVLGLVAAHHVSWAVDPAGEVRVDGRLLQSEAGLSRSSVVETGPDSQATLTIGILGTTTLSPGTRVRVENMALNESRLDFEHGTITARIGAPPRLFYVSTVSAEAIDLGCAYELTIHAASGAGLLRVTHGWVALHADTGRVYVPRGSSVRILAPGRLSVPLRDGAGEPFRAAVGEVSGTLPVVTAPSLAAIDRLAVREDALTVWHLIRRANRPGRRRLGEVLARIEPTLRVNLGAVERGDAREIERLGKGLGARESRWWAAWARQSFQKLAGAFS